MKIPPLSLILGCAFCLCACDKQASSQKLYNPGIEPLTANELASLLDMYHWKITQTPNDGKPYWGVRLIVANHGSTFLPINPAPPPYKKLATVGSLRFDNPVASDGNPQILLGLQIANGNLIGSLTATTPGKGSDTTRFQLEKLDRFFPADHPSHGMNVCSGTVWKDNRVDLIDYRDDKQQPVLAICLEFLHADPIHPWLSADAP